MEQTFYVLGKLPGLNEYTEANRESRYKGADRQGEGRDVRLTFIDFFAGIGGFRRGMELAGHKCVGFCEFDRCAVASYTAMHLCTDEQLNRLRELPFKKRQKEILNEQYKNGEWYAADIRELGAGDVPRADVWCFGAPCQDFSVAGQRRGLEGGRSSLVRQIFRLVRDKREEDKPTWLVYENVKGMLSSNRGFDFFAILLEMDELGYDVEWQILNSKHHGVPQNRERVYVVGRLRGRGAGEIFPLRGTAGEAGADTTEIRQIMQRNRPGRDNLNQYRVYDAAGISPVITSATGGGRAPSVALFGLDYSANAKERDIATAITTKNTTNGVNNWKADETVVAVPNGQHEPVPVVWYEPRGCYIAARRLTPRECFRLQGWTDDYYERAALVNSDTQLYKQAGNGVTVNVVEDIGRRLR